MNQQNTLIQKSQALELALEEFNSSAVLARSMSAVLSPALESFSVRPALEDDTTATRKNVFVRIYDFLKGLWERLLGWIKETNEKHKARAAASHNAAKTRESMKTEPEEVKAAVDKMNDATSAEAKDNLEEKSGKLMKALLSDAEKLMTDEAFLSTNFPSIVKEYGMYCTLRANSNAIFDLVARVNTGIADCAKRLEHAVQHTKNGRQQAATVIEQLFERVQVLIKDSRDLMTAVDELQEAPAKSVHELLTAAVDTRFINSLIALFEENKNLDTIAEIESDIEPLLSVFRQIADADPASLSGVAADIYAIDPNLITKLTQTPAYMMSAAGRVDTVRSRFVPASGISVDRIAAKAVEVASGGKNVTNMNKEVTLILISILEKRYK